MVRTTRKIGSEWRGSTKTGKEWSQIQLRKQNQSGRTDKEKDKRRHQYADRKEKQPAYATRRRKTRRGREHRDKKEEKIKYMALYNPAVVEWQKVPHSRSSKQRSKHVIIWVTPKDILGFYNPVPDGKVTSENLM